MEGFERAVGLGSGLRWTDDDFLVPVTVVGFLLPFEADAGRRSTGFVLLEEFVLNRTDAFGCLGLNGVFEHGVRVAYCEDVFSAPVLRVAFMDEDPMLGQLSKVT